MQPDGSRVPLGEMAARLDRFEPRSGVDPSFRLEDANLTFEPGGQIEISADPSPTISAAIDSQVTAWTAVQSVVPGRVAYTGVDLWNDLGSVPLQLRAPRYQLMDQYFHGRWPEGRQMMRHTSSLQINLDGGGPTMESRVRVAEHLVPAMIGSFSTSPTRGAYSGRARIWERLDPSRTGFLNGHTDLSEAVFKKAMSAGVIVVDRAGNWSQGDPDFDFRDWLSEGHPEWGGPNDADLRYHLSTLFTEVRPRNGTLEIRTPDSVPLRYLPALVVLVSALVYSESAGNELLDRSSEQDLIDLTRRATEHGISDQEIGDISGQAWRLALTAAQSSVGIENRHLDVAADFVERVVEQDRSLSIELSDELSRGSEHGLAWAGSA